MDPAVSAALALITTLVTVFGPELITDIHKAAEQGQDAVDILAAQRVEDILAEHGPLELELARERAILAGVTGEHVQQAAVILAKAAHAVMTAKPVPSSPSHR